MQQPNRSVRIYVYVSRSHLVIIRIVFLILSLLFCSNRAKRKQKKKQNNATIVMYAENAWEVAPIHCLWRVPDSWVVALTPTTHACTHTRWTWRLLLWTLYRTSVLFFFFFQHSSARAYFPRFIFELFDKNLKRYQ